MPSAVSYTHLAPAEEEEAKEDCGCEEECSCEEKTETCDGENCDNK